MAITPINNNEIYRNPKERVVLGSEQTGFASLSTFGHAINNKAELPVVNHFHKDKFEFVIVVNGIQMYTASGVDYTLYGGDVFITKPGEVHSSGTNPQSLNELLWFQIDIAPTDEFMGLTGKLATALFSKITGFDGRKFQLDVKLITDFIKAFSHMSLETFDQKIKGQSLFLYSLMCLLDQKPILSILSSDIDQAKQYILTHIEDTIDMDVLIGKSKLSTSKFKQKFKDQIGFTPREYINYMKIDHAKEFVANTKMSITDIAFDFSFSTSNYFCIVFKQHTGYSPKEYRKRFGNKT